MTRTAAVNSKIKQPSPGTLFKLAIIFGWMRRNVQSATVGNAGQLNPPARPCKYPEFFTFQIRRLNPEIKKLMFLARQSKMVAQQVKV